MIGQEESLLEERIKAKAKTTLFIIVDAMPFECQVPLEVLSKIPNKNWVSVDDVLAVVNADRTAHNKQLQDILDILQRETNRIITKVNEEGCPYKHKKMLFEVTLADLGGQTFLKKFEGLKL